MKHTITQTPEGYVCQSVNPYAESSAPNTGKARISSVNMDKLRRKQFLEANPPYHFVHPDPLPDNAIVDSQDLTEPFLQIFDNGHGDSKTSMAISFKHPELMECIDGVFIRKYQIKSPRLEERRKEISQEAKDRVDCHAPFQELSLYMYNGHGTILLQQDIHEIIEIVNRIEQKSIRDEMDSDMLDAQMPVGEIESCLNHWSNKYLITRK